MPLQPTMQGGKQDGPPSSNTLQHTEVKASAVLSSAFEWLPEGSEMPEETSCRFAGSQKLLMEDAGPVRARSPQ